MPDARAHDNITAVSGVILGPLCFHLLRSNGMDDTIALTGASLYFAAHIVSGMLFSPDLDIDSAIDNRWGPLYVIWRPYMWLVPHRHRLLSHGLVVSALLRLLYFYGIVFLFLTGIDALVLAAGMVLPSSEELLRRQLLDWLDQNPLLAGCVVAGFSSGSDAHIIADRLVTHHKRLLRRLGIRLKRSYRNHY